MKWPRLLRRIRWPELEHGDRLERGDGKTEQEEAGVRWPLPADDLPAERAEPWARKGDGS